MTALTSRGYVYQDAADPADGPAATQALAASLDADISACLPDLAVTTMGDFPAALIAEYPINIVSANDAHCAVIRPKATITPTKFVWFCTNQAGNYDVGIINYTTRALLWSSGSTACPVAGEVVVPIVAGPTLTAGIRYGLVIAGDDASLEFWGNYPAPMPGLPTLYDGTVGITVTGGSFPIPAVLGAGAATNALPCLMLRA